MVIVAESTRDSFPGHHDKGNAIGQRPCLVGSVCMVLASNFYDEDDYYRDYDAYLSSLACLK